MNQKPFAQILRRLRSDDPEIRRATLAQIDPDTDDVEVEDILPFLHDGDTAIRLRAISLLGRLQNVAALPALLDTLSDEDPGISTAAESASQEFRTEEAGEIFLAGLQRHDARARAVSAVALGDLQKTSFISALKKAAEDLSPVVRLAAIGALGAFPTESVEHVLHQGLYDEDDAIRLSAVKVLQARGSRRSAAYLLRTLRDRNSDVRNAGIAALDAMAAPHRRAALPLGSFDSYPPGAPAGWSDGVAEGEEIVRRAA